MKALEEGGEEEERRLCYVGITRARSRLYMTWTRERRLFGRSERNLPSRFVDELPEELTERGSSAVGWTAAGADATPDDRAGPHARASNRRRRRPRQLRRRRRHRGRARRRGRRPLRRRRLGAQADGRLRADPQAVSALTARIIDGKAIAAAVRERVRERGRRVRAPRRRPGAGAGDGAGRRGPRLRRSTSATSTRPVEEAGIRSLHHGLAGRDHRERAARAGRRARARRGGRRHPRPAAGPRPDRPRPRRRARSTRPRTSTVCTPTNAGLLAHGMPGLVSCTPAGVMELLRHEGVELEGAEAVVVGRSKLVGVPVARLLLGGQRDGHGLPLAHPRPRRRLPPRRRPRRRGRRPAACSAQTRSSRARW